MAEDNTAENVTSDATAEAPVAPVAPVAKKTHVPRTKKAAAETTATAETSATKPVKATRAKRGTKNVPAKASKATRTQTSAPDVTLAAAEDVASSAAPLDDIADLIKLEEENKRLRKLLSDKLRAENADLRKRLGQG